MTMQSVASDDGAFQSEETDCFDRRLGLTAVLCHDLAEAEEGLTFKCRHHQRRHVGGALLIGTPGALAIDRHSFWREIDAGLLAEGGHETHEAGVKSGGVDCPQHASEGVVLGGSVLQRYELPEKIKSCLSKVRHLGAMVRTAQHRRQGNKQNIKQCVLGVEISRIGNIGKCFVENHRGLRINGKPLRIHYHSKRKRHPLTHVRFPYPPRGRGRRVLTTPIKTNIITLWVSPCYHPAGRVILASLD